VPELRALHENLKLESAFLRQAPQMGLSAGTRFGPYAILSPLGKGGMPARKRLGPNESGSVNP